MSAVGTGSSGVDGVVRRLDFTLRNDGTLMPTWADTTAADELYVVGDETAVVGDERDGAEALINMLFGVDNEWARESFAPRDKTSSWNQVGGSWTPLLWPNREVVLQVAITAPGVAPVAGDWVTLFHGLLGDNIRTDGPTVVCSCRDLAKRLQDTFIEVTREYGSAAGVAAETVIQQILDDNLGAGVVTLYTPVSPGFMIRPYKCEFGSVWDKIQEIASQIGWFLGYRWDSVTGTFRLTLMEPPRSKSAANADFALDYEDDFYANDLDISDADVRNAITVWYRDSATGNRASVPSEDAASIAEYGRRAMQIEEADTSLIDTPLEAQAFADAALADLKDLTGTTHLDMPLLPSMDVFSGIVVTDPRVSSTDDFFGVESVRHTLDFDGNRYRTEIVGSGRVIGAHTRWLAMQTRPGAGKPVSGREIVSQATPAAPTGLAVASSGLEQVGQTTQSYVVLSWVRPTGYYPDRYKLQVQRTGGDWSQVQEYVVTDLSQRLILPGNVGYQARVAAITKESVQGAWSTALSFTTPADATAPATPTGLTVVPAIRGLTVTLNANTEADWDGFEIHVSTTTGFTPDATTLKSKGRATRFDLVDLTPWTTYYVKAIAYDTSNNKSAATAQVSGVAGKVDPTDLDKFDPLTFKAKKFYVMKSSVADWVVDGSALKGLRYVYKAGPSAMYRTEEVTGEFTTDTTLRRIGGNFFKITDASNVRWCVDNAGNVHVLIGRPTAALRYIKLNSTLGTLVSEKTLYTYTSPNNIAANYIVADNDGNLHVGWNEGSTRYYSKFNSDTSVTLINRSTTLGGITAGHYVFTCRNGFIYSVTPPATKPGPAAFQKMDTGGNIVATASLWNGLVSYLGACQNPSSDSILVWVDGYKLGKVDFNLGSLRVPTQRIAVSNGGSVAGGNDITFAANGTEAIVSAWTNQDGSGLNTWKKWTFACNDFTDSTLEALLDALAS